MTSESEQPQHCASSHLTLRYAKDGKGHDFTASYAHAPSSMDAEPLVVPAAAAADGVTSRRDFAGRGMRYAKDGKGFDFEASYPYHRY